MAAQPNGAGYAHDHEPGVAEHRRAVQLRHEALAALDAGEAAQALVRAVLAVEARVEELTARAVYR